MTAIRKLYVAAILVAIGCGGSTSSDVGGDTNSDAGGNDATLGNDGSATDGQVTQTDGASNDGGSSTNTIKCGQQSCDPATQECCVSQNSARCVSKGTCTTGSTLACTSAANCTSGICCGTAAQKDGGFGFTVNSTCEQTCTGQGTFQLCQGGSECASGVCRDTFGNIKTCRRATDGGIADANGGG